MKEASKKTPKVKERSKKQGASTEIKGVPGKGGARAGAGRKSAGTVGTTVRLALWEIAFLKEVAPVYFKGNLSSAHSEFMKSWAKENKLLRLYEEKRKNAASSTPLGD